VKDGNVDHITREPEQVKAFRDTWRDGIHSYLTYLRDRLTVARDLLTDSGSIFVQIGNENVHRIRAVLDEIFGEENSVATIVFKKTPALGGKYLDVINDTILYYAKSKENLKYRQLFMETEHDTYAFPMVQGESGERRRLSAAEKISFNTELGELFRTAGLTSQSGGEKSSFVVRFEGESLSPSRGSFWKTNEGGIRTLGRANRLLAVGNTLTYARFQRDFRARAFTAWWDDTIQSTFATQNIYVVQTYTKVVQRCLMMATDPGDLVLDPTCGSGTTAYVAEQWGRRWITIDTSRVALALARARIMGARYPYYLLSDSIDGQRKEAEVTHTTPSSHPTRGDIRHGFVYERVPHITLKSIANNAEIDVIWEKYEQRLAPLRGQLSVASGQKKTLEEWEIPREMPSNWSLTTQPLLTAFWEQRITRQKEIDASIAAKAEFEYLYDKPYDDKKKVRVAGPFTVESLSPHRVLTVGADDELVESGQCLVASEKKTDYKAQVTNHESPDFALMILENLKTAGVQQAHKEDKIIFTSLTPWPGDLVCAEGRYEENPSPQPSPQKGEGAKGEKRAAIFIGPEFGTVSRPDLVAAAREAGDAGFDVLITCAFNYDAHSSEFNKLGRIPVLKARMNADLHMADDLKNTGKGNLFVIFGEPDVEVVSGLWLVTKDGRMVAHYDSVKELSGLGSLEEINRVGRENLSQLKELSTGREIRADKPDSAGSGFSSSEHRGGSGEDGNRRISSESKRSERFVGRGGNIADSGGSSSGLAGSDNAGTIGRSSGDQQDARRTKALSAIKTLNPSDFPLSLTTSHYSQVTVHGVDVFHPNTGEVRSDGAEGIACWFIDTDYNEESFFVRHAYFLGANDPYKALKTTLKAEINEDAWATLNSDTSRPFDKPKTGRIAVKVINHLGDEVMKVFRVN